MSKVFKRSKASRSQRARSMGALFDRTRTTGDVGIEIECEGNKFKQKMLPVEWKYERDGSLRGRSSAEYILKEPVKFDEVPRVVKELYGCMDKFGTVLDDSHRTSVHVHLNAQKFHLNRVCSFVALYYAVEEILTEWCGDRRVGNLFCLRAKDAPAAITRLKSFFVSDGTSTIPSGLHYAGLNVHALSKFGSIEIRSLRGVTDPDTVLRWISILENIYRLSASFSDPRNICDSFSGEGPMSFLSMVLGPNERVVREGISYTEQQIMESLYEGIRIAQDLCYCRDWSLYEPQDESDPFSRNRKKAPTGQELLYTLITNPTPSPPATTIWTEVGALPVAVTEDEDTDYGF